MATNLRLRPAADEAVRAEAERSGRSQQDIIRAAVDRYLDLDQGDTRSGGGTSAWQPASTARSLPPPRIPYRRPRHRLTLPPGMTVMDLLDREDRF